MPIEVGNVPTTTCHYQRSGVGPMMPILPIAVHSKHIEFTAALCDLVA